MTFISKFLSAILIPLWVPFYLFLLLLFYFPALMGAGSSTEVWILASCILVFTVVLPIIVVSVLFRLKIISSVSLYNRKDRFIPQTFSCISYAVLSFYLVQRLGVLNVLSLAMIANLISAVLITVINQAWKISTHAAGAMGLLSITVMIYAKHPCTAFFIPMLIISVLCIGVCFARIQLKAHTVAQVLAGGALGLLIGVSVFSFLK